MKSYQECKEEIAKENLFECWDRIDYKYQHLYFDQVAELYAAQFKIKLSPDRVLTQEEFAKMYQHYQEILMNEDVAGFYADQFAMANTERNKLKEVTPDPTEEEIMAEALSASKALSDIQTDFVDGFHYAIDWYKKQINR